MTSPRRNHAKPQENADQDDRPENEGRDGEKNAKGGGQIGGVGHINKRAGCAGSETPIHVLRFPAACFLLLGPAWVGLGLGPSQDRRREPCAGDACLPWSSAGQRAASEGGAFAPSHDRVLARRQGPPTCGCVLTGAACLTHNTRLPASTHLPVETE